MIETEYLGSETLPPEGYLQPVMYRVNCMCLRCGHEYSWKTKTPGGKDRPCPRKACKEAAIEEEIERRVRNMAQIIEEQKAPGVVGANVMVKAVDVTANVVMEDYKLTNLQDNIRTGDIVAPKLPPKMQAAADGFFNNQAVAGRAGINTSRQAEMLGKRAIAGHFRGMSVPPSAVNPSARSGDSALRFVRKDPI